MFDLSETVITDLHRNLNHMVCTCSYYLQSLNLLDYVFFIL